MSHQDQSEIEGRLNSAHLVRALQCLLTGLNWGTVRFRRDCTWTPKLLSAAALLWAWSGEATLGERFVTVRRLIEHLFSPEALAASYQAFLKLLCRWTVELVNLHQVQLRERMQVTLNPHWLCCGFPCFGVDGSRLELPRTKSHELAFSPSSTRSGKKKRDRRKKPGHAAHQKKATLPLLWLTTMFHLGTGLPWDWRIGPSDSSEREHALDMLSALPPEALLVGDAGFVGYDFARAVLNSGRHLLVRVGANVRLLKGLGFVRKEGGIVYVWPEKAAKQNLKPLVFRLVIMQGPRHPIYLISSIFDSERLNDEHVWQLYQKRWGIELFYRTLKQTFRRRKLRSTSAANAAVELEWSLVGLWALGLLAAVEIQRHDIPLKRISMAGVLNAIRRLMRDYLHPVERRQTLARLLCAALVDEYTRKSKKSRDYPRKKKHTTTGVPSIVTATPNQIRQAKALRNAA